MTLETISETVNAYNEMLDDCYNSFNIGTQFNQLSFPASRILSELDPIAYKCGWIDWCDAEGIDTDLLEDDYTFDRDRA